MLKIILKILITYISIMIIESPNKNINLFEFSNIKNDPFCYNNNNYLEELGINEIHDVCVGSQDLKIGIIDSGILSTHEDLLGRVNVNLSRDLTYQGNPLLPTVSHGTNVAGFIGAIANNNIGISGSNLTSELVSLKVSEFDYIRQETVIKDQSIVNAINFAQNNGIDIINISLVAINEETDFDAIYNAMNSFDGPIIISAGNDNDNLDNYPEISYLNLDNVIVVGAIDSQSNKASYSNFGQNSVDLYAPGNNIITTTLNNGYSTVSGTSFAAPIVTGVISLLLSYDLTLTPLQIKNIINNTADLVPSLNDKCVSGGKINAINAFNHLLNHDYVISSYNGDYHKYVCWCGKEYIEEHNSYNHYCLDCGNTTNDHTFAAPYLYIDRFKHSETCVCGETREHPHSVQIINGITSSYCMYCGGFVGRGLINFDKLNFTLGPNRSCEAFYRGIYYIKRGDFLL